MIDPESSRGEATLSDRLGALERRVRELEDERAVRDLVSRAMPLPPTFTWRATTPPSLQRRASTTSETTAPTSTWMTLLRAYSGATRLPRSSTDP
jgi:hypothetical protein